MNDTIFEGDLDIFVGRQFRRMAVKQLIAELSDSRRVYKRTMRRISDLAGAKIKLPLASLDKVVYSSLARHD